MSDLPGGPGWWQASDGKWYPPQQAPPPAQTLPAVTATPKGKSKLPFIIGGVGVVILLVIAIVVFAGGGGKKENVTAGGGSTASSQTSTGPSSSSSSTPTTSGSSSSQNAQSKVTVVEKGFVAAPQSYDATKQTVSGAAVLVNGGDTATGRIEATFTFLGANGTPYLTDTDFLTFLNPGEKGFMTVEDHIPTGNTVTSMEVVLAVEMDPYAPGYQAHTFPTSDVRLEPSSSLYTSVVGTLTNDLAQPVDSVQVTVILRDANGVLLTGDTTYSDTIAPGQKVAFEALTPVELVPTAASAEARAATSASTTIG